MDKPAIPRTNTGARTAAAAEVGVTLRGQEVEDVDADAGLTTGGRCCRRNGSTTTREAGTTNAESDPFTRQTRKCIPSEPSIRPMSEPQGSYRLRQFQ